MQKARVLYMNGHHQCFSAPVTKDGMVKLAKQTIRISWDNKINLMGGKMASGDKTGIRRICKTDSVNHKNSPEINFIFYLHGNIQVSSCITFVNFYRKMTSHSANDVIITSE